MVYLPGELWFTGLFIKSSTKQCPATGYLKTFTPVNVGTVSYTKSISVKSQLQFQASQQGQQQDPSKAGQTLYGFDLIFCLFVYIVEEALNLLELSVTKLTGGSMFTFRESTPHCDRSTDLYSVSIKAAGSGSAERQIRTFSLS